MTVDDLQLWVSGSLKKVSFSLLCQATFLFFIYLFVVILRSVIRAYKAYTHRKSPKFHLLRFTVQHMQ